MALWLVRAGKYGEREDFALKNKMVVIGWDDVPDLAAIKDRKELAALLAQVYLDAKPKTLMAWESQLWAFSKDIAIGELVAMPLKHRSVIALGEITGDYAYRKDHPPESRHARPVKWLKELPRSAFDKDLLYSLGSARTIARISRNDAEARVRKMLAGKKPIELEGKNNGEEPDAVVNIEEVARDQISEYIIRKFKGHGLSYLVGAILQAQGYQVRVAPEGPDGGVDIIAGRGALGFEQPRLVAQVKSTSSPADVSVLRELQGVMSSFGADQGLIVSWSGYKGSVEKEAARQYFKIRLWDANDLVIMLQENYELLPEDIQAELPLKRIWTLVQEEE